MIRDINAPKHELELTVFNMEGEQIPTSSVLKRKYKELMIIILGCHHTNQNIFILK